MKFYLFLSIPCLFYLSTSTKIKPELKKNILNFGYGINYNMREFILPLIGNQKFSNLNYDNTCAYLDSRNAQNMETRKYMLDLRTFERRLNHLKFIIKDW